MDFGNKVDTDSCLNNCHNATCGDGVVQGAEECDDGNPLDTDPCLHTCKKNVCGDGFVDATTEGCDDTNTDNNDGCSNACEQGAVAIGSGPYAQHMCAIRGGHVRCWGHNQFGKLGIGSTANLGDELDDLPSDDVIVGGLATAIVAAGNHTCALLDTKKVRCWGYNWTSNLGFKNQGETIGDEPGEMLANTNNLAQIVDAVAQIDAGSDHTCAVLNTGKLRCWGYGTAGQLGQPFKLVGTPDELGDVAVGDAVKQVATGMEHTCALLVDGSVRCWGRNLYGELGLPGAGTVGDNETPESKLPVNIGGKVVEIDAGERHTCARLQNNALRCWGLNGFGQLGYQHSNNIGDNEDPAAAGDVKVLQPGETVKKLALGGDRSCVLLTSGDVRCWGWGKFGGLGQGNEGSIGGGALDKAPLVELGGKALDLAAGRAHTCALLDGGAVRCWGYNSWGALGVNHTNHVGDDPGEMPPKDALIYPNP